MAKVNQTEFKLCPFRSLDYLPTLKEFAADGEFRFCVTIPAIAMSPIATFSNGVVIVGMCLYCSQRKTPAGQLMLCLLFSDALIGCVFLPLYTVWTLTDHALSSCVVTGCLLFSGWFLTFISFMTIVAVSIDRFFALFCTFKYKMIVTSSRTIKLIIFIWISSAVQSTMALFHDITIPRYILLGVLLSFGLFILVFTYARIFKLVRYHHRQINSQHVQIHHENAKQQKLAITMAYVIGVILLCYTPFGIALAIYVAQGQFTKSLLQYFHLSELFFCASSFCNPLIYCMRNLEIRTAVLTLFRNINSKLFCRKGFSARKDHTTEQPTPNCLTKDLVNTQNVMATLDVKI